MDEVKKGLRIGLVGAGGTGKTTLGAEVASACGISFLQAKALTQPILQRDKYDYASGIQVERFLAANGRQEEILKATVAQQTAAAQFVTDRTFVDLAAYAICELHDHDTGTLLKMCETCREHVSVYTHLFVCPWIRQDLKANGKRTLNVWYQFLVHSLEHSLMDEWGVKFHVLKSAKAGRVKELLEVLEAKP